MYMYMCMYICIYVYTYKQIKYFVYNECPKCRMFVEHILQIFRISPSF